MVDTLSDKIPTRDIFYYRKRLKNRVFGQIVKFFTEFHENTGITKKEMAHKLSKHPSQITRWLSNPGNLTLDTISDLLLAAEAELGMVEIVKFSERQKVNYANNLYSEILSATSSSRKKSLQHEVIVISTEKKSVGKIDIFPQPNNEKRNTISVELA